MAYDVLWPSAFMQIGVDFGEKEKQGRRENMEEGSRPLSLSLSSFWPILIRCKRSLFNLMWRNPMDNIHSHKGKLINSSRTSRYTDFIIGSISAPDSSLHTMTMSIVICSTIMYVCLACFTFCRYAFGCCDKSSMYMVDSSSLLLQVHCMSVYGLLLSFHLYDDRL